jgi:hypothetical protein
MEHGEISVASRSNVDFDEAAHATATASGKPKASRTVISSRATVSGIVRSMYSKSPHATRP